MSPVARPSRRCRSVLYVEASEYWGAPLDLLVGTLAHPAFQQEVQAAVAASSGPVYDRLSSLGHCPVYPIPARRLSRSRGWRQLPPSAFQLARTTTKLVRLIRRLQPDILQGNSLNGALFASWAAAQTGTPLIWHMHDVLSDSRLNRVLVRWLAARSARVVPVSAAVGQRLAHLGVPERKLRIIHNGLEPDDWRIETGAAAAARAAWAIPATAVVFLHLGSLVRLKGQDVFLTAAQALAAAHPQVFFLMVGSPLGDHEPDYARAVIARAQAAGPAFRYVPALADPRPAFAAADVLVQTSAWPEAFGMVLLEAMACAKPVIAPRQGGPLEVVEDGVTGFLFDPKRVDELVAALRALVTQPDLRERMGAAGRRRLDGHFTRRRQVRALLELYRELTPDLTAC